MKTTLILIVLLMTATLVMADEHPQTTCPVMKGNPVNKSQYVDVEGYRIYVCCGGCISKIQADPAKYINEMKAEGVEVAEAPEPPVVE